MSKWFVKLRLSKTPKLRIFLFPHAGAGPSIFRNWEQNFSSDTDLLAVHLPGRETRFNEKPINCLDTIVKHLTIEILPYCDRPCIFVGHSNGALIAFALAQELARQKSFRLLHMVVSAKNSPNDPYERKKPFEMSDDEFLMDLKQTSSIPAEILSDKEAMELFLPVLRADYSVGLDCKHSKFYKLRCDASLFWGAQDEGVPLASMLGWQNLFEGHVETYEFAGDHFFILTEKERFVSKLSEILENY